MSTAAEQKLTRREEYLFKAKLAEQTERYDDMAVWMRKIVELNDESSPELTVEERNLLSVAYKNVIGARRSSWRVVSAIEQKEESRGKQECCKNIKYAREQVEKELREMAAEILDLLQTKLIPHAKTADSIVFYYKMQGDYNRYLAEIATGTAREEVAKRSLDAYSQATDKATTELQPTHPIRLGLALNFSTPMNPRGTPRRVTSENSLRIPDVAGHLPYFPAYCAFCQLSRHPHNCSPVNHEINWTVCVVLKFRSAPEHFSLPISFDVTSDFPITLSQQSTCLKESGFTHSGCRTSRLEHST
nr:unnamed protein product [Spirometra erinaceieuropaei]